MRISIHPLLYSLAISLGIAGPAAADVSGTVSLAPQLMDQANAQATVFIFARAAQGPRMPLALARIQAKDLPYHYKLDDSMGMSPRMRLSSFPKVNIVARVSKSGNAMPASGDLEGTSKTTSSNSQGIDIVIDRIIP